MRWAAPADSDDRGLIFLAQSGRRGEIRRMAERTETGSSPPAAPVSRAREYALYGAAWLAGAVPLFAVITALWLAPHAFGSTGDITVGAFALAYPVVVRRLGIPRGTRFVQFLLLAGIAFGIFSVLTGAGNGLTDEPFTTPRFVTLLWAHEDPYVVPLVFNYVQYGQTIHSSSIYPYLPLLMFLQIPGLDYKWFTLGCWAGMVLLVRKRFDMGMLLGQPYVVVMAASGYNDFPVLLLLSVAFVGIGGHRQRWAQILALGAKQFANAIVVVYYLVKRDWKNVGVTVAVSAAFILPFVVWSGPVVLCPTVFADRLPSCPSGGSPQYLLNYALYPVWLVAIFYVAADRAIRSSAEKGPLSRVFTAGRVSVDAVLRTPSFGIVGASGAMAGVSAFLAVGVFLGASVPATLASVLVGFALFAGWTVAWNGVGSAGGPLTGRSLSPIRFHAVVHSVALALNVGVVLGAVVLGRPALDGEIVGVFLAALWESAVFFRAQYLPNPRGSPPRAVSSTGGGAA